MRPVGGGGRSEMNVQAGMLRRRLGARGCSGERFQPETQRGELSGMIKALRNCCQRREKVKLKKLISGSCRNVNFIQREKIMNIFIRTSQKIKLSRINLVRAGVQ